MGLSPQYSRGEPSALPVTIAVTHWQDARAKGRGLVVTAPTAAGLWTA